MKETILQARLGRRAVSTGICLMAAAAVVLTIRTFLAADRPVAYPTANIPDAARFGNPEQAVEQSRQLLTALRSVDYNPWKVPHALTILPDYKMAERDLWRTGKMSTFTFCSRSPYPGPLRDQVAFYTDLYVRDNPVVYSGDRQAMRPTGFYIVAFKDGRVNTVPVEDVRITKRTQVRGFDPVFPGMTDYDPKLMRLPRVEFAGEKTPSEEALAFYRSVEDTAECETCTK